MSTEEQYRSGASRRSPLPVLITVDTEIWPTRNLNSTWNVDDALDRHYFGKTGTGLFGVPYQLEVLNRHGLKAVYFVEALVANALGRSVLQAMTEPILNAGQDIELHLHTEWAEFFTDPVVRGHGCANTRDFSQSDQIKLLSTGLENLAACGVPAVRAFRAGNFGANTNTLAALSKVGIPFDTSYNHCFPDDSFPEIRRHPMLNAPWMEDRVCELPVTCFSDLPLHTRPLQICACSTAEMISALNSAWHLGWSSVVIVSHSFELLNRSRTGVDRLVKRRFDQLCQFLENQRARFRTVGFGDIQPSDVLPDTTDQTWPHDPISIRSRLDRTVGRMAEQAARRVLWNRAPEQPWPYE